jgi:hypothetical protein
MTEEERDREELEEGLLIEWMKKKRRKRKWCEEEERKIRKK